MPGLHYGYHIITMNALNGKYLDDIMVIILLPWMHRMGNAWVTLWLTYFYYECSKWEIPGWHYGYHAFTMNALKWEMSGWPYGYLTFMINALNGINLDYIMVIVLLPWMH